MGIKESYGASVRTQLKHFPVWDLGSAVRVGDYGTIDENCFTRLGNVEDDYQVTPLLDPASPPAPWSFRSAGTRVDNADVSASVPGVAKASLVVKFSTAHSLYIDAPNSTILAMKNIAQVASQIDDIGKDAMVPWRRDYCFVSSVRRTPCLTLLVNTQESSSITLMADASVLEALKVGTASGTGGIAVTGDAGLTYVGQDGAVYVDLIKLSFFGRPAPAGAAQIYAVVDPAL